MRRHKSVALKTWVLVWVLGVAALSAALFTPEDAQAQALNFDPPTLTVTEGQSRLFFVTLGSVPSSGAATVFSENSDAISLGGLFTSFGNRIAFFHSDFTARRTITVIAEEDDDSNNETAIISFASVGGIESADYTVTIEDDDSPPGVISVTSLSVDEGGSSTYTVELAVAPDNDVTVTLSSDNSDVLLQPIANQGSTTNQAAALALTFTTMNWNTQQTVNVVAEQDTNADDGGSPVDDMATIAQVVTTTTGGNYDGVTADSVMVRVNDDELANRAPNFISTEAMPMTVERYTLAANYALTLPEAESGDGNLSYSLSPNFPSLLGLSFDAMTRVISGTPGRLTGAAGVIDLTYTVSDSDSMTGAADEASLTFTLAPMRDVVIVAPDGTISIAAGGASSYQVFLGSEPNLDGQTSGHVTVTASSDNTDYATAPAPLTFTATNWHERQTVFITGIDGDADAIPNPTVTISNTLSGADYGSVSASSVQVTVQEDNVAGITVSAADAGLTIAEDAMDTYTVVLTSAPAPSVTATITPSTSASTDATFTPAVLSFTTTNWNTAQTVTVNGVDDADANVPDTVTLSHAVSGYRGITTGFDDSSLHTFTMADPVRVTITETDMREVTVSESARTVAEGSSSSSANVYTVVLSSQPVGGAVTITPSSGDTDVATVVPAALTFTGTDWNTAQTLTITGVMDDDAIPDAAVNITHTVAGADYGSNSVTAAAVAVTVTENDTAMITVGTIGNVAEGGSATYSVMLSSAPMSMATITPSSSDENVATVSGALIFSASNWNMAQMVTVTGEQDADAIPDSAVTITLDVMGYMGITAIGQTMSANIMMAMAREVTVVENDVAGVTVSDIPVTVGEAMSSTYTVVLTSSPADATMATITPSSSDPGTTVGAALTFTPGDAGNWNTPQTVTVTSVMDDNAVSERVTITHAVSGYMGVTVANDMAAVAVPIAADPVDFTVTDNGSTGVIVSTQSMMLELFEGESGGVSDTYTVVLTSEPAADVTVTPSASLTDAVATPGALTFSAANWNTTQTVTLSATEDDNGIDGTIIISHSVTSADTTYRDDAPLDMPPADVVVMVADAQSGEALAAVNEVVLPEVAHALAVGQVTAIANRIQQAGSISGGATVPSFNFGGQTTLADMAARHAQTLADDDMDMKRLLGDSDFAMPLNAHGGNGIGGSTLAFWGGGDYRSLGGKSGSTEWDGDMFSIQLGLDTRLRPGLLGGLMVTYSETDIDYKAPPRTGAAVETGEYKVEITSFNPYLSWGALDGKLDIWATLGYGDGEVTITPDANADNPSTSDLTTQTLGLGGSGQLLASEDGITELRLNIEGFHTTADIEGAAATDAASEIQALQVDASRYRLLLEATRTHTTANGATVKPSIEAGARYDGGDGETGTGFEVGGAITYRNPAKGMTLEARAHGLLSHSADYEEWGIGGHIRLDPGPDAQGLSVSLAPRYGNPDTNPQALWNNGLRNTDTATQKDDSPALTLTAKLAYGLPAATLSGPLSPFPDNGTLTPYTAMTLGQTTQTYRLGLQWQLHKLFDLNLFAKRSEKDNEATDHTFQLEGEVSF